MKLAKKISKGIALCATLAIIGWGGVTSCSNGSEDTTPVETDDPNKKPETPAADPDESKLELTSIIEGIVDGDDVWGSGTKTVKESDGSYTVTAAGAGQGTWGGNIAAIPVQISAGDLVGFSHIVVTGVDISGFTLNEDSEQHPSIELKIADEKDTAAKTKVINATKLLKEGKIEISLADVEADILKDASKVMLNFRGTGTIKIKDISKAKAKATTTTDDKKDDTSTPADKDEDKEEEQKPVESKPDATTPDDKTPAEDDKKDEGKNPPTVDDEKDKDKEDTDKDDPDSEDPPAKEGTVLYKLDFSGAEVPANNYMSNQDNAKFVPNEGAKITGAWAEFAFVPKEMPNLKDATHVKVNFKCSEDAAFDANDNDNNKFMLGGYKYSEAEEKDTNVSWTCFLKGGTDEFPTDFTTVEKEIKWEQKYDDKGNPIAFASFDDIGGLKIWDCNFEKGSLYIKSIEFIKK